MGNAKVSILVSKFLSSLRQSIIDSQWVFFQEHTYDTVCHAGRFNPILHGFWHDVITRVWSIMAHINFRHHNFAKRPLSTQNLLSDKTFDL